MATDLNPLPARTRRTEPVSSTTEGEEILMVTIRAANSGKALLKVPTVQVLPNSMGNYQVEEAILPSKEIVIAIFE